MTRRENTNNLGQCFVLDIRHTIYGSIIGMSLCGFSHNKLKKKEMKKYRNVIENKFVNRKLEKVPRAPVYKTSKKTDKVIPTCLFFNFTIN